MKQTHCCPKCASHHILRIPDRPGRYSSGNNIYTSNFTLVGKIPVIRYVCADCGYTENWVDDPGDLAALRRTFG